MSIPPSAPSVPTTAQCVYGSNGRRISIPLLIVAAFWYLVITSILMIGQFYLERYFGRGSNRVQPLTPMQKLKLRLGIGGPPKQKVDPRSAAIDPDAEIAVEQMGPKG